MQSDIFKKAIGEIKAIRLSKEEKSIILERVLRGRIKSPYWSPYAMVVRVRQSKFYALSFAVVLLASVGGSVVLAAEGSVPGDMLYSVKVKVTEPALDKLFVTAERNARWQGEKTVRRLWEAETLALQGRLDAEKSKVIEEKIKEHGEEFHTVIRELSTSTESETREHVEVEYESQVKAHSRILNKLSESHADETKVSIEQVALTLGKELKRNQEREVERNRERKEKAKGEKREAVPEEALNRRFQDAERSVEATSRDIKMEEVNFRNFQEDVGKTILEESGRIIEDTRDKIRQTREKRDRGDADEERMISDIEDSERKIFETKTMLQEIKKMDRPGKKKAKDSRLRREKEESEKVER